jgi:hypothetical protein
MRYPRLLFATVLLVASTVTASADTYTYTYTGHDFNDVTAPYTTSDFVSGSFTLAAPIAANTSVFSSDIEPISFSFSDGVQTIDSNDGSNNSFVIGTDSMGAINEWVIVLSVSLGQTDRDLGTRKMDPLSASRDSGNNAAGGEGEIVADPGTWVETVNSSAVPEPSTLALLGSGILGLAGVAGRKLS